MTVRNEFKYDLFQSDLPEIISTVESQYAEFHRPLPTTLTLYFCDTRLGPPAIDFLFRLRAYAYLDHAPTSLHDIKMLQWRAETKDGHEKTLLGTIEGLPEGETWNLFGAKRLPLNIKICQRRHFAIGEAGDEFRRLTIDISRSLYKLVGQQLEYIGDMGPRVEVKVPKSEQEDSLPLAGRLRALSHYVPYSSLTCYSQFVLRQLFPEHTHTSLPEIECKYAITSGSPQQVFDELFSFLSTAKEHSWRLLLPFPHIMVRTRRYHVCHGLGPGSSATIVETTSGKCSLKTKDDTRSEGSALLRATLASHTTDINGQAVMANEFARASGLRKINEFIKLQRKVPIVLPNGHGYQFTVDACTDPHHRSLCQLEIEYSGSTNGSIPLAGQILREIQAIGSIIMASPLGAFLASTHLTKHAFFTKDSQAGQEVPIHKCAKPGREELVKRWAP